MENYSDPKIEFFIKNLRTLRCMEIAAAMEYLLKEKNKLLKQSQIDISKINKLTRNIKETL